MLSSPLPERAYRIYLSLAEYPMLKTRIRAQMRRKLYEHGYVDPKIFESKVRERATASQAREGVKNPLWDETGEMWNLRLERVRSTLTDSHFAEYFTYADFEDIVRAVLGDRVEPGNNIIIAFNPELAPQEMLFDQALAIEKLPDSEYERFKHRHNELIVVLIRKIISDQLAFINIAKEWFTAADLMDIQRQKIGYGRIGGKAAGMLLASNILQKSADPAIRSQIKIPESFYIGADVMYEFMSFNELHHWSDQKYKTPEQIRADFPELEQEYRRGSFPPDIIEKLAVLLDKVGNKPLIVRSSSLLEDNFGMSFAGKYESVFCPNQGTPAANLIHLMQAMTQVYASILNPDALFYRRSMNLQDYDERVALLIQVIEGEQWDKYYFPHVAGVGFSRNTYRWSPQIRAEDGFLRLVWGLGTRAVDRVGRDYPRMVALSHPLLRPQSTPDAIRRYSQHYIDLINLESNQIETHPVHDILDKKYPPLRYLAQIDQGGYLSMIRSILVGGEVNQLVLTLDGLLQNTAFTQMMKSILQLLEEKYRLPVDIEFVVYIRNLRTSPEIQVSLLQCRPQSHAKEQNTQTFNKVKLGNQKNVVFSSTRMVPHGIIEQIEYVLYVSPQAYYNLPTPAARSELGRVIGRLNAKMEKGSFICVGPGRWGTTNPDLGVHIGYSDIYHAKALIELAGKNIGPEPELSFGTHFFQDLVEAQIFPLAIYLDDDGVVFNLDFFENTPNHLADLSLQDAAYADCLRIIKVSDYKKDHHLEVLMDSEVGKAIGYLRKDA